jgi:hypothetical protein
MTRIVILLASLAIYPFASNAEEAKGGSENQLKIEDLKPKSLAPGEDVDEVLTNKYMRAQSGSKSKISISNSLNYQGGTVERPLAENRPNITGGTGNTAVASLTDTISAKIAIDQRHAILGGFGARWITPLQGSDTPDSYNGNKTDAYDPYVKYQYVYKWYGVQSVMTTGVTATTQNNLVRQGYVGNAILQQNNAYEFGHTGISLGLLSAAIGAAYDDNSPKFLPGQADYTVGLYPFLEYVINDRLNIRTISGVWVFEHLRSEPRAATLFKDTIYQSVGLGISISRDVFLYPNIQIIPEDIRADRTNVALAATVNLF